MLRIPARSSLYSIQQRRQNDCLTHLEFGVELETVTMPDCVLQTAEDLAGFGNPAGHFIVDLGGAGEYAAQMREVVHHLQLGDVCDLVGGEDRLWSQDDDEAALTFPQWTLFQMVVQAVEKDSSKDPSSDAQQGDASMVIAELAVAFQLIKMDDCGVLEIPRYFSSTPDLLEERRQVVHELGATVLVDFSRDHGTSVGAEKKSGSFGCGTVDSFNVGEDVGGAVDVGFVQAVVFANQVADGGVVVIESVPMLAACPNEDGQRRRLDCVTQFTPSVLPGGVLVSGGGGGGSSSNNWEDLSVETIELLLREKYDETENRLGHAQITQLLKFCLKTYFTFDRTIYEQVK
nr:unnamed protein product [Spirometra erinaceieuropaei]